MASLEEAYLPLTINKKKPLFPEKIKFGDVVIDTLNLIDSYPSSYYYNGKVKCVRKIQKKLSKLGYDINGDSKILTEEQINFLHHINIEISEADKFDEEIEFQAELDYFDD